MEMVAGSYQQRLLPFMETTRPSKVCLKMFSYRLNQTQFAPQLVAQKYGNIKDLNMISITLFQTLVRTVISLIPRTVLLLKKRDRVLSGTLALVHQRRNGTMSPKILCMTLAHSTMKTLCSPRKTLLMLRQILTTNGTLKIYKQKILMLMLIFRSKLSPIQSAHLLDALNTSRRKLVLDTPSTMMFPTLVEMVILTLT